MVDLGDSKLHWYIMFAKFGEHMLHVYLKGQSYKPPQKKQQQWTYNIIKNKQANQIKKHI